MRGGAEFWQGRKIVRALTAFLAVSGFDPLPPHLTGEFVGEGYGLLEFGVSVLV